MNSNGMERFNEEIRDREKTMRGLKIKDTPILTGYQTFHNHIRTHEGLNARLRAHKLLKNLTKNGKAHASPIALWERTVIPYLTP